MVNRNWSLVMVCSLALLALLTSHVPAQGTVPETAAEPLEVTPEREAAALSFARAHHPELAQLLGRLKKSDRAGFEAAVRDLFRTRERLSRMQARSPERYELGLALWKIESRIHLLAARQSLEPVAEREEQIRELLKKKLRVRSQLLQFEHARLTSRVERLETEIQAIESDTDALVDKELQRLRRSTGMRRGPATFSGNQKLPKPAVVERRTSETKAEEKGRPGEGSGKSQRGTKPKEQEVEKAKKPSISKTSEKP